MLKVTDDLGSGIGPHVCTACEVALLTEHQVCVKVGHAFFLCNLMHGLALVALQPWPHIGYQDIVECESEQDA